MAKSKGPRSEPFALHLSQRQWPTFTPPHWPVFAPPLTPLRHFHKFKDAAKQLSGSANVFERLTWSETGSREKTGSALLIGVTMSR
jgi:hypothetical protein